MMAEGVEKYVSGLRRERVVRWRKGEGESGSGGRRREGGKVVFICEEGEREEGLRADKGGERRRLRFKD